VLGLRPDVLPVGGVAVLLLLLLSRAGWRIGSALMFVGAFRTITHVTTEANRGEWIGYMRAGKSLGFPVGLVLGGVATDLFGYDVAFLTAGSSGTAAALLGWLVLPNVRGVEEPATSMPELLSTIRADTRIVAIGLVNFVVRFIFIGILLSTAVLYVDHAGIEFLSLTGLGIGGVVMAICVVSSSTTSVLVSRYYDSLSSRSAVTLPAVTILATGFGLLAVFATLVTTALAVFLIGIGVGGTTSPLLAILGEIGPTRTLGNSAACSMSSVTSAWRCGPLVGLPGSARRGFTTSYLACFELIGLVAILVVETL
jgi:predicted MFS family arabinose efflux permease